MAVTFKTNTTFSDEAMMAMVDGMKANVPFKLVIDGETIDPYGIMPASNGLKLSRALNSEDDEYLYKSKRFIHHYMNKTTLSKFGNPYQRNHELLVNPDIVLDKKTLKLYHLGMSKRITDRVELPIGDAIRYVSHVDGGKQMIRSINKISNIPIVIDVYKSKTTGMLYYETVADTLISMGYQTVRKRYGKYWLCSKVNDTGTRYYVYGFLNNRLSLVKR